MKKCPQAIVEVETEFHQESLPVVCMDRCIYDLIIGNDINKHEVESNKVKQTKPRKEEKLVKVIFENSKLGQSEPQHVKDSDGDYTETQNMSAARKMLAAVQTRAQKQADLSAPRPLKVKKVKALNISCKEFKQLQKEDEGLSRYWKLATEQQSSEDTKAEFFVKKRSCIENTRLDLIQILLSRFVYLKVK